MDWDVESPEITPSLAKKRSFDDSCADDTQLNKMKPPSFQLRKEISELEKEKIVEQKGLSNAKIIISSFNREPMSKINASILNKEIRQKVSLHKDISEMDITRNKNIIIHARSTACRQQILQIKTLGDQNVLPQILNDTISVKYVVHDIDIDISLDEIGKELEYNEIDWFQIVRFTKNINGRRVPVPTILIKEYGSAIPERLKLWYMRYRISVFIEKPKMCFKCLKFGHTKIACRGHTTCSKCGDAHELNDCKKEMPLCFRCQGLHQATDKSCPKYLMELEILKLKSERNISYSESKRYLNALKPTYSKVAQPKRVEPNVENDKLLKSIDQLTRQVELLTNLLLSKGKDRDSSDLNALDTIVPSVKIVTGFLETPKSLQNKPQVNEETNYSDITSLRDIALSNVKTLQSDKQEKSDDFNDKGIAVDTAISENSTTIRSSRQRVKVLKLK